MFEVGELNLSKSGQFHLLCIVYLD
jgi:hypothetical protein